MANGFECGCSAGRTFLIDPNLAAGNGLTGTFVPPEDLNIYVELTTTAKSRSVISVDGQGTQYNETSEKSLTKISFIDGSDIGQKNSDGTPKKTLTTKYTELTTVFNKTKDTENLGISSIDIDFNSSYVPLIKIEFVDVRGSSVFQHGADSPYSVFFELPYPIFELTIKGYYGKAVKYCLHLTKWNSRFNAQTGNFEITAEFIGYTYAMLTDMLLGYLRAITKTPRGKKKFEEMRADVEANGSTEDIASFITINDLLDLIEVLNVTLVKVKETDVDIKQLANNQDVLNSIDNLQEFIDEKIKSLKGTDEGVIFDNGDGLFGIKDATDKDGLYNAYQNDVTRKINDINKQLDKTLQINIDEYTTKVTKKNDITLDNIKNDDQTTVTYLSGGLSDEEWERYKDMLVDKITKTSTSGDFDVFDFRTAKADIKNVRIKVAKNETELTEAIGKKASEIVESTLGFQPTIRNIFNIFTTHVEIFLECLKDVSIEANLDDNGLRATELDKLGENDVHFDVHKSAPKIYPWPLYRKQKDDNSGYEERYIGSEENIIADNIPELVFVEELLEGLIKVNTEENERLEALQNLGLGKENTWFAVNPIDTPMFGLETCPWTNPSVSDTNNEDDIIKMAMLRAMAFFGSSGRNDLLIEEEVRGMAAGDAAAAASFILNKDMRDLITNYGSGDGIADSHVDQGKLAIKNMLKPIADSTKETAVLVEEGNYYKHNWIHDDTNGDFIPFNGNFTRSGFFEGSNTTISKTDADILFLNIKNQSKISNGVFLKIFDETEYNNIQSAYPAFNDTDSFDNADHINFVNAGQEGYNNPVVNYLGEIPQDNTVGRIFGFNIFNGKFNTQEIKTLQIDGSAAIKQQVETFTDDNTLPAWASFYIDPLYNVGYGTTLSEGADKQRRPDNGYIYTDYAITNKDTNEIFGGSRELQSKRAHTRRDSRFIPSSAKIRKLLGRAESDKDIWVGDIQFVSEMDGDDYGWNGPHEVNSFSLFGSRLYFEQRRSYNPKAARAYLFLHTLPWNGLVDGHNESYGIFDNTNVPNIYNLFAFRPSFVYTPRAWAAFIGALLWRLDKSPINDTVGSEHLGGSGTWDPIKWGLTNSQSPTANPTDTYYFETFDPHPVKDKEDRYIFNWFPRRDQYCTSSNAYASMQIGGNGAGEYKNISSVLKGLPRDVKREFKRIFFEFVNGSDWETIRENLEIFPKDWEKSNSNQTPGTIYFDKTTGVVGADFSNGSTLWKYKFTSINGGGDQYEFNLNQFRGEALENYTKFSRALTYSEYDDSNNSRHDTKYNYLLEIKSNARIQNVLKKVFTDKIVIGNCNSRIWMLNEDTSSVKVSKTNLEKYMATWFKIFKEFNGKNEEIDNIAEEQAKQELFNTMDDDAIRLNIYRHCKAVYDKWIAGTGQDIIFSCGSRPDKDGETAKYKGRSKLRLIDSFKFVNRAFNDIGDKFLINPAFVTSILTKNYNQSFYSLISRILADNNFNFVPLPSYVDYETHEEMCGLFEANIFNNTLNNQVSGPAFVCVYVGQHSNKLDMGSKSDYPNDGFDMICDDANNLIGVPQDFTTQKQKHEHNIPAFMVNYGHENQNIFKDVKLDQREFAETDESLVITDSITNNASQSNRTFAGQNLWNIYQVRSYSAEVEAMGNAQIQPMMYFQLNNIPMFHGAYMIINVNHRIKPNHMSTNFKGVRIRHTDTPLIDAETLYMSLLGSLSDVDGSGTVVGSQIVGGSGVNRTGSYAQKYGSFVTYDVKPNEGLKYQETNPNANGDSFAMEAVGKFMQALAIKWHEANKDKTNSDTLFINNFGAYGGGTSKGHTSDKTLHAAGRAVDLRPMMKAKKPINKGDWHVGKSNYSQEKNKEFMQMAIEMSKSNEYGVKIDNIILNDNTLINYFAGQGVKNSSGGNMVISAKDHDNHIHIEFEEPDNVAKKLAAGENGDAIVTNGVKGEITDDKTKRLTKEEMLKNLGKI